MATGGYNGAMEAGSQGVKEAGGLDVIRSGLEVTPKMYRCSPPSLQLENFWLFFLRSCHEIKEG